MATLQLEDKMISGTQRAYGEWYAHSISLDDLYRATPSARISRQVIRADARAFKKEAAQLEKKRLRRLKKQIKRNKAQATMTDNMMKGGSITI